MSIHKVFSAQTVDGLSTVVNLPVDGEGNELAGQVTFYGVGTWGGGNLVLQISPEETGSNWLGLTGVGALSGDGLISAVSAVIKRARLVVTGATSPNIDAWLGFEDEGTTET